LYLYRFEHFVMGPHSIIHVSIQIWKMPNLTWSSQSGESIQIWTFVMGRRCVNTDLNGSQQTVSPSQVCLYRFEQIQNRSKASHLGVSIQIWTLCNRLSFRHRCVYTGLNNSQQVSCSGSKAGVSIQILNIPNRSVVVGQTQISKRSKASHLGVSIQIWTLCNGSLLRCEQFQVFPYGRVEQTMSNIHYINW